MKTLRIYSFVLLMALWAPIAVVVGRGASWSAMKALFAYSEILEALGSSALLALCSGIISALAGLATAFAAPEFNARVRASLKMGLVLPLVLPEIAFGLAFLVWFVFLRMPLGWTTLIAAHVAFTFPFATLVISSNVEKYQPQFAEAAQDLGANWWNVLRHAVVPQILPGLVGAFVLSFSLSFDDFLISFFVKGIDQITMPVKIYSMARLQVGDELYALCTLLFLTSAIGVIATQLWMKRWRNLRQF